MINLTNSMEQSSPSDSQSSPETMYEHDDIGPRGTEHYYQGYLIWAT